MNKYIVLSFAFMAFAFYELSGGDEFTPRKAELMAEAKAAKAAEEADRLVRSTNARPSSNPLPSSVSEVALRTVSEPTVFTVSNEDPVEELEQAEIGTQQQVPVTLVSLEQGGAMFARPITQLVTTPDQARPVLATRTLPPADLREVAGIRVNMRKGPGTGYDVVTSLPQGTTVEVIDADGSGWVKLRTVDEDLVGWMAEYLLSDPTG